MGTKISHRFQVSAATDQARQLRHGMPVTFVTNFGANFALCANKAEWSHVSQVQSEIGAGGQPRREKNTALGRRKKRKKDKQEITTFKCGQLATDRSYDHMSFRARKLDDSIFLACFKLHVLHLVLNGANALSFI